MKAMHNAKRNDTLLVILAILLVGGLGYWIFEKNKTEVVPGTGEPEVISEAAARYASREHGISFSYPEGYAVFESDPSPSRHEIALVEDTEENRAVFEGRAPEGREGPIAITIDIRKNPSRASAESWARSSADSNLSLGGGLFATTTIDGAEGIAYPWSGLYEGETVAVSRGERIYVFTATYITSEDPTARDFARVLESVQLD